MRTVGMVFKINVLQALKDKGYSTYRIKNEKLLSQSTLQKLREGKPVSWENIEAFCRLLELQPGELLEYKPDATEWLIFLSLTVKWHKKRSQQGTRQYVLSDLLTYWKHQNSKWIIVDSLHWNDKKFTEKSFLVLTNKKRCCNIKMYVEKVNTKSPSLNSQLNDRLTRKGISPTSNEFLMPKQALYAFWIYVCQVNAFLRELLRYWLGILFCYTCLYVCA